MTCKHGTPDCPREMRPHTTIVCRACWGDAVKETQRRVHDECRGAGPTHPDCSLCQTEDA